MIFTKNTQ